MNLKFLVFQLFFLFAAAEASMPRGNFFDKDIVFQPQFLWADGTCTEQGTGSFIKGPNGLVIGLTSAHFINFCGPQLLEVKWLDVKTGKPIARSLKSYGMPGREGTYDPLDLRSDYFLLLVEGNFEHVKVLEMDERNSIEPGERVWFPNKDASAKFGYQLIGGTVSKSNVEYYLITLDDNINLLSRSGTPIISQQTHKVIGLLTGGDKRNLYVTPGRAVFKALIGQQHCFLLQEVVGKPSQIN